MSLLLSCCLGMMVRHLDAPSLASASVAEFEASVPAPPSYSDSVVRIVATEPDGGALGTGVVVRNGVRTCWHVVRDAVEVTIKGADGKERKASCWWRTEVDAALICFDEPLGLPSLDEAFDLPRERFEATCVGYWGRSASEAVPVTLTGSVFPQIPVTYRGSGTGWLATSIPLMKGLSGSPLIYDGRVIGLASQRDDTWSHTLFTRLSDDALTR
jgi:S1-C subfamily serine protease